MVLKMDSKILDTLLDSASDEDRSELEKAITRFNLAELEHKNSKENLARMIEDLRLSGKLVDTPWASITRSLNRDYKNMGSDHRDPSPLF